MSDLQMTEALTVSDLPDSDLKLTATPSAVKQFHALMAEFGVEGFRFGVMPGGCSGFEYILAPLDDVMDDDERITVNNVNIVIDIFSSQYLDGTLIHYKSDVMGSGFSFQNPNASGGCGCGSSFTV